MAITPGEGGVDICLVSPSDQAGQINNLLDRVHNLEVAVAQLAGLDVNASNLSDMVASLGTIINGTIIMPDNSVSGWTNSVPPGNFTGTIISNGIITTWNNGVVSFEVQPSGITVGGGGNKRCVRSDMATVDCTDGVMTTLPLNNPTTNNDTIGITFSTSSWRFPRTGFYFVSAGIIAPTFTSVEDGRLYITVYSDTGEDYITYDHSWGGSTGNSESWGYGPTVSGFIDCDNVSDDFFIDIVLGGNGTTQARLWNLTIIEL